MSRLGRMTSRRPYHHGDLRRTLLDTTAEMVAAVGPSSWSLREVARRAGVSHAAPAHHFGDRSGLLLALATEGFELLCDELETTDAATEGRPAADRHIQQGLAYVRFATANRGHFAVMFRTDLFERDAAWIAVASRAFELLRASAARLCEATGRNDLDDLIAASWGLVHGLADLANSGNLGPLGKRGPIGVAEAALHAVIDGPARSAAS